MKSTVRKSYIEEVMEDRPFHEPSEYIRHDLDLLILLGLIQAHQNKATIINFGELYKGNFWKQEKYVYDANFNDDLADSPLLILDHVHFLIEDIGFGSIKTVLVDDIEKAIDDFILNIARHGEETVKEGIMYFSSVMNDLSHIKSDSEKQFQAQLDSDPDNFKKYFDSKGKDISSSAIDSYVKDFESVIVELPDHILLEIDYDEKAIKKIEQDIESYINAFADNSVGSDVPFSQQIELFFKYIKKFNAIGKVINVPFTILDERDFEAVKILKYLEMNGRLKIDWLANSLWQLTFSTSPITLDSLIHSDTPIEMEPMGSKLKYNLSFIADTTVITFTDFEGQPIDVKITGAAQKDVIRAFFKVPENTYQRWTMYDLSTAANRDEKSVLNALFQLNNKVGKKLTSIKKFIEYNQDYAQINLKYVVQN